MACNFVFDAPELPKGFLTFTQAVYIAIMSRPATIFTGLVVSGAILYHFRAELSSDMRQVRNQLSDVQNRLAGSVPGSKISNVRMRSCLNLEDDW